MSVRPMVGLIVAVALAAGTPHVSADPEMSAPAMAPEASPPSPTTHPAPSIPAVIPPIPVPEVAQSAEQAAILLRAAERSPADARVEKVETDLAATEEWIRHRLVGTGQTLVSVPSVDALENLTDLWRVVRSRLVASNDTLTRYATLLDQQRLQLDQTRATWNVTRENALRSGAPLSVVQRVDATLGAIRAARASVDARLAHTLALQDRVASEIARCDDVLARIGEAGNAIAGPLLSRDALPVWNHGERALTSPEAQQRLIESLADMIELTRGFLGAQRARVPLQAALLVVVFLLARGARAASRRRAEREPDRDTAAQIFNVPLSCAVVVALLATPWIYPQTPRLVMNVVGLLALLPAVLIARRLIPSAAAPAVYALAVFFLVDRVREICSAVPVLEQRVFLLEMVAGIAFLALGIRSQRFLTTAVADAAPVRPRIAAWVMWVLLWALGVAVLAGALGSMRLARRLGSGVLVSSYLALVLYAAVRVGDGLLAFVLRAWPARRLLMVQHHGERLQRRGSSALRWLAVGPWLYFTLDALGLLGPIWSAGVAVLETRYARGSFSLSLADVAVFAVTVGAAFAVSSLVRFVLHEDIYPRIWLPRGVPDAISTLIGYAIILAGFLVAILTLGMNLDRLTLLAGALGVGVGIGLQSAVANFVSGLILLLERRIHVGDLVQIGDLHGQVREIGSRASTIRTWDGAEVIVPNASLTSERVTNWTLSDRMRRVTIPVGIARTADPERAMGVLRDVARAHPKALADPPPVALCTGFGESTLNLELRVWTARTEDAESMQSQLVVGVHAALAATKIEIPVPRRDIHIRNEDGQPPVLGP